MAGDGRLDRIRARLRRRRSEARGREAVEEDEPGAGWERPGLDSIHESRREALARWLASIRDRAREGRGHERGAWVARARDGLRAGGEAAAAAARRATAAAGDAWFALPLAARQRIAAALALAAVAAAVVFVVVPLAPCWVPGGDRCPPSDDAIGLVPADAGAYLHLNLAPDTDQGEAAAGLAGRLPDLVPAAASLLPAAAGQAIDYERDIAPWSGGEIAVAIAADGVRLERLLLVEVDDPKGAARFGRRALGRGVSSSKLDGTRIRVDARGRATALADGFLLLGPESLVRRSLELAPADSLNVDPAARRAREELPEERLADLYVSAGLVRALRRRGELGAFNTFVDASSSEGVAAAFTVADGSIELSVRSVLDEERAAKHPDFFAALPLYEPKLTGAVAADTLVYLGVGDPGKSAATLAGQAAATAPDLFAGLEAFTRRLRRRGGVNLERQVLPLLEGEAALTVEPAPRRRSEGTPGVVASPGVPYLALLASGVDVEKALRVLARLQGPVSEAIDPAAGQAPVFEQREIDGVAAQSLRLSRVVDLTYAGFDDRLVIGTSPAAVERARGDGSRLADAGGYKDATDGFPEQVSMLIYVDFRDLLSFAERLFLAEDPAYAALAPDLRTLNSAALAVTRTRSSLATDARVTVGEAPAPESGGVAPESEPG